MTILYLHGLMSSNQSNKIEWLKEKHHVFNPQLNYKKDSKTIFAELEAICENTIVHLIIGSSLGGYLGYHISNKFNIPSLLFNPALEQTTAEKPDVNCVNNTNVLHTIVLGENDDVISPIKTLQFLENRNSNFVHSYAPTGHRTPFEIFKKHFNSL
ncbi:hypothetical protein ES677_10625 [Bizionia gelidisalsuginis]|uniref:Alpha/beta hydrolase n=2 Tax=Bizionia TaxID=283785 RepID=A0A8H2LDB5_9FLAO|nr:MULTISPECIES: YqiA/YcfP family alpha/beta fold hydrolase [Bizionia]TYB71516.1 hypothetical protein ES676_12680 [Bizionia saleffrena]TYC10764.1 hypothetical protein ES677_10625 [Bizionia gelidisalsuginis]